MVKLIAVLSSDTFSFIFFALQNMRHLKRIQNPYKGMPLNIYGLNFDLHSCLRYIFLCVNGFTNYLIIPILSTFQGMMNSIMNPIIYAFWYSQFRLRISKAWQQLFRKFFKQAKGQFRLAEAHVGKAGLLRITQQNCVQSQLPGTSKTFVYLPRWPLECPKIKPVFEAGKKENF